MRNVLFGRLATCVTACALVACSKGTEPPTPTTINVSPSSSVAFTAVNQTQLLTATVLDQHGATMAGVKVTWATNNVLVATVDTLGVIKAKANGSATVTASSGGASKPVSVTVAQAAATITKSGGDGQVGGIGSALGTQISVQVLDANGNAAVGVSVTFSTSAGSGTPSPATVLTAAGGTASTTWTLGPSAPRQTVTATAGSLSPVTFVAGAVSSTLATGFQITLVNDGPAFSAPVQAAFDSAVAKWQRVITGDIADIPGFAVAASGVCPAVSSITVDDVLIVARVDSIDGPGKILGQAGPCWIRSTGFLSIMGVMTFDSVDVAGLVASGSLNAVIMHEMGHVLGFGTLWGSSLFNCLQNPSAAGALVDTYYSCARGLAVFDSIGGTSYTGGLKVPVENCVGITSPCGAGTFNSHWRESTFFNELMTGYLNNGTANPLSVLTAAQMQDLGYTVNLGAADAYSRVFTSPPAATAAQQTQRIELGDDVYHAPIYVWGNGRPVGVIRPQ